MCNYADNKIRSRSKLLIIDDDETTRILIKDVLEDTGIPILESGCGMQAYGILRNNRDEIGLILLDIRLPDYDGWLLITGIRRLAPEIPVIAISAIFPHELAAKYKSAGFTEYMAKPFDTQQLEAIVISYLQTETP
ncbi:MAG: response regulator [Bacteroidales bacterium]|jgi:DNA-binding NtrC family response regulator